MKYAEWPCGWTHITDEADRSAFRRRRARPTGQSSVVIKAGVETTDGRFALAETTLEPGFPGPKPHVHRKTLDMFFVLEGTLTMELGEETLDLPRGLVRPRSPWNGAHVLEPHGRAGEAAQHGRACRPRELSPRAVLAGAMADDPIDPAAMAEIASRYEHRHGRIARRGRAVKRQVRRARRLAGLGLAARLRFSGDERQEEDREDDALGAVHRDADPGAPIALRRVRLGERVEQRSRDRPRHVQVVGRRRGGRSRASRRDRTRRSCAEAGTRGTGAPRPARC